MKRLTEYHDGVAVIKDKSLLPKAVKKLAALEDQEEIRCKEKMPPDWKQTFMRRFERRL